MRGQDLQVSISYGAALFKKALLMLYGNALCIYVYHRVQSLCGRQVNESIHKGLKHEASENIPLKAFIVSTKIKGLTKQTLGRSLIS